MAVADAPVLVGLDPNKPMNLPIKVQAAYNDDTMFFNIEWDGDRGDMHDYVRYTNGAWRNEGGTRRDAQSTIDNDPRRGPTNIKSTSYESRVAFMVNDPNGPNAVPGFSQYGCMMTCHDNSRAMPLGDPTKELTKYLNDDTTGSLDLWHHRLGRANPIGVSDDFNVGRVLEGQEDEGGRRGDQGNGPWQTNSIVNGKPTYTLDPSTTGGLFAFKWEDLHESPNRYFRRGDARERGAGPVPGGIDYAQAEAQGYVPQEGDTVPRRRLREPTESRGDITAFGTTFTPSAADPLFGHIESNTQRLLDTGNPDDTAMAEGGVYDIAFAVHTGMVTVRDHYVSFPMTLSLGGGDADIQAVKVPGSGRDTLPNFDDIDQFPEVETNLFLPGVTSLEFVNNEDKGRVYIDPVTNTPIRQSHAGASGLKAGGSCRDCHTASDDEEAGFVPGPNGFFAGSMESLVPRRGGVNTPTPLPRLGDYNYDGNLVLDDINLLINEIDAGTNSKLFDLNNDNKVDSADLAEWATAPSIGNTWLGDSNLDGEFNSGDFVQVFQRGEYEDAIADNSGWDDGDWTGDREFNTGDFVAAFQAGGYEQGPRAAALAAVPEPSGVALLILGGLLLLPHRVRSSPRL